MTIIVAIAHGKHITMGADSSSYSPESIQSFQGSKLIQSNGWICGFTGDGWGTGQLASIAEFPKEASEQALRRVFVPSMIRLMEEYGGSDQSTAQFLVGKKGNLYEIDTQDWGIIKLNEDAIGGAYMYSLGSLYSTKAYKNQERRVKKALDAAIFLSPVATGPTHIITI